VPRHDVAAAFRERDGAVERAARAFRQLHDRAPDFRIPLRAVPDDRRLPRGARSPRGRRLPEGLHDVVGEAGGVREALVANRLPLKALPLRPALRELSSIPGERMWIVDWEYSG
jgi:hypothetical protein